VRWLLVLVVSTGCRQLLGFDSVAEPPDAGSKCSLTEACPQGVCKLPDGVCVGCLDSSDCTGTTAVCDLATNTCVGCEAHADCESHACDFATGSCLPEAEIAYVTANGTGTSCTQAAPCPSLAAAVATDRRLIKFEGTSKVVVASEQTITSNVRILADRGVALARSSDGPVVRVRDAMVEIEDLEIRQGGGPSGDAIALEGATSRLVLDRVLLDDNEGRGVNAIEGELVMRHSIVALNINGGLAIGGTFEISNCIIALNGSAASTVGGVRLTTESSGSLFEFNTVANNATDATNTTQAGINCDLGLSGSSNLVADNSLDSTCTFNFSLFSGTTAVPPNGTNNKSGAPMFASTADPHVASFYRIQFGSAAIDSADPTATVADDIDRDPRSAPSDIGADELVP
jgi:hypothetical protein